MGGGGNSGGIEVADRLLVLESTDFELKNDPYVSVPRDSKSLGNYFQNSKEPTHT